MTPDTLDLTHYTFHLAPYTRQVMEFSKPFKYQGITILQKRVTQTR